MMRRTAGLLLGRGILGERSRLMRWGRRLSRSWLGCSRLSWNLGCRNKITLSNQNHHSSPCRLLFLLCAFQRDAVVSFHDSPRKIPEKRRNLFLPLPHRINSKSMSRPLTFVTGNANKLKEVSKILSSGGSNAFSLNSRDLNLPEIQGSTREVASAKCRAAAEAIGGPCMTEVRPDLGEGI